LLVGSVYCTVPLFWLVFHRFLERWRNYGRRAYMFIVPAWGMFAAAAFALAWQIRHLHLYESRLPWVLGVLFILAGFSIYRSALQGFNRAQISGLVELEPGHHEQKLVITGIRRQVRHPIYLGHLCEVFGWAVGTGSIALCTLLVFGAITGAIMIRKEDRELEERFGDVFRQYRQQVPALLPKFPM
jgi:protein-S-isoprenylcysteine O-methyltransferase Ste14